MTDSVNMDMACDRAQQFLDHAIANAAKQTRVLSPKGSCYNCHEQIQAGHLFCDCDCRDDWQKRNKNR